MPQRLTSSLLAASMLALAPGVASARKPVGTTAGPTGGASGTPPAAVRSIACRSHCTGPRSAKVGGLVRLRGRNLDRAAIVVFLGGSSAADDRRAPALRPRADRLDVRVPRGAVSGPLEVIAKDGTGSPPSPAPVVVGDAPSTDAPAVGAVAGAGDVFPIAGKHEFGLGAGRFGAGRGGRSHQGQDVFAKCGTPLVAARGGTVTFRKFQSLAGNYVVIGAPSGEGMAYMHLKAPATVDKGDTVTAGEAIGEVGDTGDAHGCHLHFELWTAPGWYTGGHAVDPLPFLRSVDKRR